MIEIRNLKIPIENAREQLERQIMKRLHTKQVPEYRILKRSIDARKKPEIFYVFTVGIQESGQSHFRKYINNNDIRN